MKRSLLSFAWLVALPALFFAASGYSGNRVSTPPHDNSNFKLHQITLKHKLATGDFISGDVSADAVKLRFEVEFAPGQTLPSKTPLRVELRRLCGLPGSGGNFLTNRFQEEFISVNKEVTITNRLAAIEFDVHCPNCPRSSVCQFPHDHTDNDSDHLGEGPYEALITTAGPTASPSMTKVGLSAGTEPIANGEPARVVHSLIFSTCKTQCNEASTDSQLRNLMKLSKKPAPKSKGQ